MEPDEPFARDKHVKYFQRCLHLLPAQSAPYDAMRMSIAFFSICGLEVLDALNDMNTTARKSICDWIYSLQILPSEDGDCQKCGFQGGDTFNVLDSQVGDVKHCNNHFANGHLAMTYTGLASLVTLGDDLSRVNRTAIVAGVRALQQPDGSFSATLLGSENDMRFVYCASCVCYILQDWSGMDMDKTLDYIKKSLSYDLGFGQGPNLESHGGVTYCAVASLILMDQLHVLTEKEIEGLKKWAIMRQVSGFQGRANKQVDSCYSFWVGATLKMLDFYDKVDFTANRRYIMSTQDSALGGFAKWKDEMPDPLHSYLGLCGLSFVGESGLVEVHPALNISMRAANYLKKLHQSW